MSMGIGCHPVMSNRWLQAGITMSAGDPPPLISCRRGKLPLDLPHLPCQSIQASEAGNIPVPERILLRGHAGGVYAGTRDGFRHQGHGGDDDMIADLQMAKDAGPAPDAAGASPARGTNSPCDGTANRPRCAQHA